MGMLHPIIKIKAFSIGAEIRRCATSESDCVLELKLACCSQ